MISDYLKARSLEKSLSSQQGNFSGANADLLHLAKQLQNLPRNQSLNGMRRRAYLHETLVEPTAQGNRLIRVGFYFGSAAVALGLTLTTVLASSSFPGSPLYALKSNSQKIRVSLTGDETAKANLQIQFAEQRLAETEQLLQSNATPETKSAAISALTSQNLATVETVKKVAVAQKNTELLNRLTAITSSQTTVLTNAKDPEVQDAAKNALVATEAGSKVLAQAKELVAASSDSAIANLPTTLAGTITKISTGEIIVNKDVVNVSDDTEVTDSKNQTTKPALKIGQQVTVIAVKTDGGFTAQKITVDSEAVTLKTKTNPIEIEEQNKSDLQSDTVNAPTVQSGVLIESPEPQYPEN